MEKRNLAARAGHWSATHRKKAIFGWLGFVVVAFMIGNAVTQKTIHGADNFSGESGRAETALYDSGLRPNDENVMVQSDSLTIQDPRFRSAVTQASNELSKAQYVVNVESPVGGNLRLDPLDGGPEPRVDLGEVDLAVLLQTWRRGDDARVRALPVIHPLLAVLVGAHPQQDGGGEVLPHAHARFHR